MGRFRREREQSSKFRWKSLIFWPFTLSRYIGSMGGAWYTRLFLRLSSLGLFLGIAFGTPLLIFYGAMAQGYDLDEVVEMPERTIVYDARKDEFMQLHGENRSIVAYDEVAPVFVDALVAREDERFFKHGGVDLLGIARATLRNIKDRKFTQGGSTLTMQLARNSFSLGGDTLHRKLLEIAVAIRIENRFSKEEVLQHYMNRIFWGQNIRGVEMASQAYFSKSASELDTSEAAMLAGIIRGPNYFSPFKSMERATAERDDTLDRMVAAEKLTQAAASEIKAQPLKVDPQGRRKSRDSYAEASLRKELDLILEQEKITLGGLQVFTTLDMKLQKEAERSLGARLDRWEKSKAYKHQTKAEFDALQKKNPDAAPQYLQGAVVAIDNQSGAIRVLVGGRDASDSEFDRARKAQRSVGSLFKPFVYATAFNKGLLPGSYVSDARVTREEYPDLPSGWSPANSDGKFGGFMPAYLALVRSRNTPAVRVGAYSGIDRIREMAGSAGFLGEIPNNYASFLGSFNATPMEVASAYTTFPNNGSRPRPYLIEEIRDRNGKTLYRSGVLPVPVYSQGATWVTAQILQGVTQAGGTASRTKELGFTAPSGGKTGTTKNYTNAWFAGFSSEITCCVWVGMDSQNQSIGSGAYGSTMALPVWVDVMKEAQSLGYPANEIGSNPPTEKCTVCRFSAKRATTGCQQATRAYPTELPLDLVPREVCTQHPGNPLDRNIGASPRRAVPAN